MEKNFEFNNKMNIPFVNSLAFSLICFLVPSSDLCEFAVQQYVGSLSNSFDMCHFCDNQQGIPRNEKIMQMFLQYAEKNARTKEEKDEVEFYSIYLRKLTALQQGKIQCDEYVIWAIL